jgi:hypothetical protein
VVALLVEAEEERIADERPPAPRAARLEVTAA